MQVMARLETSDGAPFRKRERRYVLRLDVVGQASGDSSFDGLVHNLSSSGFLLESAAPLSVGDRFSLNLPHGDPVEAEIVWRDGDFCGCMFDGRLSKSEISAARLKGSSAAEEPLPAEEEPHSPLLSRRGQLSALMLFALVSWLSIFLAVRGLH